jgi:Ser/Thr protein kinase RdoA (MazF antagonist)
MLKLTLLLSMVRAYKALMHLDASEINLIFAFSASRIHTRTHRHT